MVVCTELYRHDHRVWSWNSHLCSFEINDRICIQVFEAARLSECLPRPFDTTVYYSCKQFYIVGTPQGNLAMKLTILHQHSHRTLYCVSFQNNTTDTPEITSNILLIVMLLSSETALTLDGKSHNAADQISIE